MKIRNGFVSNSSSSSFIVIDRGEYFPKHTLEKLFYEKKDWDITRKKITIPTNKGLSKFSWEVERYYDFIAKLNYIAIQALSINDKKERYEAKDIIEKAIGMETGDDYTVEWDYNAIEWDSPNYFAYIDHESCSYEHNSIKQCWHCNKAFESIEAMHAFLFNPRSYVQGGNDNTGWEEGDEYCDSLEKMYGKVYIKHYNGEYYNGNQPYHEGTCKYNPNNELLFCDDWTTKEGKSLGDYKDKCKYFGLDKDNIFFDGYYFCSNPCDKEDCPFRKWHFIKDDKDIMSDNYIKEYMNWRPELNECDSRKEV